MNSLELFLEQQQWDAVAALNALQDAGVVSDLCVTPAEVASANCYAACAWLQANFKPEVPAVAR